MFGLKKKREAYKNEMMDELNSYLLDGETMDNVYYSNEDWICITDKRIIYIDYDFDTDDPIDRQIYSIPFSKIESVSIQYRMKMLSNYDAIELITKGKKHILKIYRDLDMVQVFKHISSKTI